MVAVLLALAALMIVVGVVTGLRVEGVKVIVPAVILVVVLGVGMAFKLTLLAGVIVVVAAVVGMKIIAEVLAAVETVVVVSQPLHVLSHSPGTTAHKSCSKIV